MLSPVVKGANRMVATQTLNNPELPMLHIFPFNEIRIITEHFPSCFFIEENTAEK